MSVILYDNFCEFAQHGQISFAKDPEGISDWSDRKPRKA